MKFIVDNWMLIVIALTSGGLLLWPMIKGSAGGGLGAAEVVTLMNREKAIVVDVCEQGEYDAGHIGAARHLPLAELEARLPEVAKNKALPLVLVCASGMRSSRAVSVARKLGYEKVFSLRGGMNAWKEANLPVSKT